MSSLKTVTLREVFQKRDVSTILTRLLEILNAEKVSADELMDFSDQYAVLLSSLPVFDLHSDFSIGVVASRYPFKLYQGNSTFNFGLQKGVIYAGGVPALSLLADAGDGDELVVLQAVNAIYARFDARDILLIESLGFIPAMIRKALIPTRYSGPVHAKYISDALSVACVALAALDEHVTGDFKLLNNFLFAGFSTATEVVNALASL